MESDFGLEELFDAAHRRREDDVDDGARDGDVYDKSYDDDAYGDDAEEEEEEEEEPKSPRAAGGSDDKQRRFVERNTAAVRPRAVTTTHRKRSRGDGFVPLPNPVGPKWMADAFEDEEEPVEENRSRRAEKRGKRGGGTRTHAAASKAFVKRVLRWSVSGLRRDTREALGEPPMVEASMMYESLEHYYAVCEELAYEEARASLSAALARFGSARAFRVSIKALPKAKGMGEVRLIEATRIGGASSTSVDSQNDWRRPATAVLLKRHARDAGVLTIVAASQEAANSFSVPLWVRESDLPEGDGATCFAVALDSLISHQRMACACFMRPKVCFSHQLLGHRPSTHTKFDSSDSEPETLEMASGMVSPEGASVESETVSEDSIVEENFFDVSGLNPSQRKSLHRFMNGNGHMDQLQMVQGPPGCGKTHFTVSLLNALLEGKKKRVLVCAPSNKAVCVAMELYLRSLGKKRADVAPCILLGVEDSLQEVCSTSSDDVSPMHFFIFSRAAHIASRLQNALDEMKASKMSQHTIDSVVAALDLARRQIMASAPHFLKGELKAKFQTLESMLKQSDATLANEIYNAGASLAQTIGEGSGRGDKVNDFAYEALNKAQLVFCTLASAGQSIMASLNSPDVLLVDEAAQALEPELVIPFLRNPRKCLLVGDPAQLPATLSSEIARRHGHATSLMERLMSVNDEIVSLLDTQYRMHPEISRWPRGHFYDGKLNDAIDVSKRERPEGMPPWLDPYTFVDIRGDEGGGRGESKHNAREADFATRLIEKITRGAQGGGKFSIVVITFYSAQVRLIRRKLAECGCAEVPVHSVDSFQGSEADIVICSAVRSNARASVGFLSDRRRLNVALTRARHALVVLGSALTLSAAKDDTLNALVRDAKERGRLTSEDAFISSD